MKRKKVFVALFFPDLFLKEVAKDLLEYNDIKEVVVCGNGLEIFYDDTHRHEWEVLAAIERVMGRKGFPVRLNFS